MGVGGADNPLWLDVLEWGPESAYAGWFDIDWGAGKGKLLAPVLGAQYGEALRAGDLKLKFDEDGGFAVWAYDAHKLPICPLTYPLVLGRERRSAGPHGGPVSGPAELAAAESPRGRTSSRRELAELAKQDGCSTTRSTRASPRINGDWRALAELIAAQHWRVAFFRVAEDEINYRRFFNINDLAGLRMELAPVFAHAHARVFRMLESGEIDGLRIDHIDGLFDPKAYLSALRERCRASPSIWSSRRSSPPHEALRADWPVEGTTGYDYLNLSLGS